MSQVLPSGHFCGTCSHRRDVGGLLVMETRYAPGHANAAHAHELASFSLVLDGSFEHRTRGTSVACAPATLLLHDAGDVHAETFHSEGARCLVVQLGAQWMKRVAGRAGSLGGFELHRPGPAAALAREIHTEIRSPDEASDLAIEGLVLQLLAAARRATPSARQERRIPSAVKVRDLLHARFADRLSLQDLADATGLHPVSIAQAFRKAYGESVGAYQRRLRIEFTCRELTHGHRSLTEIALAAGFYDQSHFTRTFCRLVGTTPARYRAAAGPP